MTDLLFPRQTEELVLKPIQEDMVSQLRDAFKKHRRVVLMAGTGLGKTIIATHIIQNASKKGKRCLFVNDRRTLVRQTSAVFDRFGVDHGVIMADDPRYLPSKRVQIGSVHTLNRRGIRKYDMIIVDECHTQYKGLDKILKINPDAFVLGLSATPFSKGLGKIYETCIEPYSLRSLIDSGLLCDFEVYGPETYDLSKVKTVAGEYHQKQLEAVVDQTELVADIVKTYLKLGKGRKTICFVQSIPHGRHLARQFKKNGIKADEINHRHKGDVRREIMDGFISGDTEVLCSVEILIKGFDLTSVDCVVWATATKSPIKWIQGTGRGLRAHPGKTLCRVIDHGSNCARLGFPDEFEFWGLDDGKRSEAGSKQKEKEHAEKLPKRCPSCDFLKPAGVLKCPACGLVPEYAEAVETIDGNIVKLKRSDITPPTMAQKRKWYAGLLAYAQSKGLKRGWADHTYREKFGVWPRNKFSIAPGEVTKDVMDFIVHKRIKWAKSQQLKGA